VRAKGKGDMRISVDSEEVKNLGNKLDRAVEEFDVSTLYVQLPVLICITGYLLHPRRARRGGCTRACVITLQTP
jgi:hypothetical protein